MNKPKKLFLILIIIVVLVGVWFFFNPFKQTITFQEGKQKIAGFWSESEINISDLNSLTVSRLSNLKSSLESFKLELNSKTDDSEKQALLSYLQIQLKLVEGLMLQAELNAKLNSFSQIQENAEKICSSLNDLKLIAEKATALNSLNNELILEARNFAESFPEFAGEMQGITSMKVSPNFNFSENLEKLSELCNKGVLN